MKIFQDNTLFDKQDTISLRGMCMIMIIIHHIYQYTSAKYGVLYPLPLALLFQDAGYLATGVFFLLSGWGMYKSLESNAPISFGYVLKHVWKLLQPFLFIYIIDVIVYTCVNGWNSMLFAKNLITLSLTSSGTLWFMKVIFCSYITLFAIHFMLKSIKARLIAIWAICLSYVLISLFVFKLGSQWWNSIFCLPLGYALANNNTSDVIFRRQKCNKMSCVYGGGNALIYN